jgi:hypothetical protein
LRVVLHFIDGCQLNPMIFRLDGHAHLSTGVKPAHIGTPTADAARRIGTPHPIDNRPGRLAEILPLIPRCQLGFSEH